MRVLIVENDPELGRVWCRHIERLGGQVTLVHGQTDAVDALRYDPVNVIVLNLDLIDGSAFAIADYASYRQPEVKVIFVTSSTFFADGSIFSFSPNACGFLRTAAPPEDIAAMVEHYGGPS